MNDLEQRLRTLADPDLDRDAPPPVAVGDRLVAGETALRRRRLRILVGSTAAAVALSVVTVGALQAVRGSGDTSPSVFADGTSSVEITVDDNLETEDAGVAFNERGELERHSDAVVTQVVENPIPTDAEKSVALALSFGDEESWVYLYWSPGGPDGGGSDPAGDSEDFLAWAHAIVLGELESQEQTAS